MSSFMMRLRDVGAAVHDLMFDEAEELLILAYINGELPAGAARAFEYRLEHDTPFFERAAPLINRLRFGPRVRRDPMDEAVRMEASRQRLWHSSRAAFGLPPKPYDRALMLSQTDDAEDADSWSMSQIGQKVERVLAPWQVQKWAFATTGALMLIVAGLIARDKYAVAHQASMEAAEGRAASGWIWKPGSVETSRAEETTHHFRGGSAALLGPSSRVHYRFYEPVARTDTAELAVDGDVTVTVGSAETFVRVRTHDVDAVLEPGTYHIHAAPGTDWTAITVDSGGGSATIHPLNAAQRRYTLVKGEHGTFTPMGEVR